MPFSHRLVDFSAQSAWQCRRYTAMTRTRVFLVMEDLGDEDLSVASHSFMGYPAASSMKKPWMSYAVFMAILSNPFRRRPYRSWRGSMQLYTTGSGTTFASILSPGFAKSNSRLKKTPPLEDELISLALRLDSAPQALIHRDFQSQNVMIRSGEPVLIDFQGMRRGNPPVRSRFPPVRSLCHPDPGRAGDIASHTTTMSQGRRQVGIVFWSNSGAEQPKGSCRPSGAYGFLGLLKGRQQFLGHIAPGLRNLEEATRNVRTLALPQRPCKAMSTGLGRIAAYTAASALIAQT